MRFQDKVAFVTGGASGLGAAATARFASEGARVIVADIDQGGAQRPLHQLPAEESGEKSALSTATASSTA